jgi:hypothetical protein
MRAHRIGNRGSTLIEAAVALVLLGTVVAVTWLVVAATGRAAVAERSHILAAVELADLDRALRDGARRVRVPLWLPPQGFARVEAQAATVPYVDGAADGALEVDGAEGIVLTLPDREHRFRRLHLDSVALAAGDDGAPYGLELVVAGPGGEHRMVAAFGAVPW